MSARTSGWCGSRWRWWDTADLGGPEQVWSPVIEFSALGETAAEAEASVERLLRTLRDLVAPALQAGRGEAS